MKKLAPPWLVDLLERTAATFAQAFLAIETVDQAGITQLSALKTAGVAGGYAVAKYLLVRANAFLGPNVAEITAADTTPVAPSSSSGK